MNHIDIAFGNVTAKKIVTPNDFVSHMIEHIAWRLGCSIDLAWDNEDWDALGKALGWRIAGFEAVGTSGAAMGMLDDGSAEALVEIHPIPHLNMTAGSTVDLDWFLSLRCEQMTSGAPLVRLLEGLAMGLAARITVVVCNLEDPHHTWEGVFRAIGEALNKIFTPPAPAGRILAPLETNIDRGDILIVSRSSNMAEIKRQTAESGLSVLVDFHQKQPFRFEYQGAAIDHYRETNALQSFNQLLQSVAETAGFSIQVDFWAKALSSSHVLLEDTGLVLGLALREILVKRMMDSGVNGVGYSLEQTDDFHNQPIRVAVSVEGRKFWRFVPLNTTLDHLKRNLVIGQTIMNGLFSEDLDDFLDGLSWGLGASIMIHVKELPPAEEAWIMIFKNLGKALHQVYQINPHRKGVPPGVKANLS